MTTFSPLRALLIPVALLLAACSTVPESRPGDLEAGLLNPPTAKDLSGAAGKAYGRFCASENLDPDDPTCRRAFMKAWASNSWQSAEPTIRSGFARMDKAARRGASFMGRKWSEYRESFREGVEETYEVEDEVIRP